jgi:tetratricopeptide (TPR) repeat protein
LSAADSLCEQGLAAHRAGRLDEARDRYERALTADARHFDSLHHLGLIFAAIGEPVRGVELMERAAAVNPNVAALQSNLGWILAEAGRLDDAIAACRRAIALNPRSVEAYANLGSAQLRLQSYDEAIASYDQALRLDPRHAAAHYNRANALRDRGALADALTSYEAALRLQPGFVEAWINRGGVFERLRYPEAALASFDQAIAIRPDLAVAHANRAKVLNDLKRSQAALASAERAIELQPHFAVAHNDRALALFDLRRLEEALAACERAIALDPDFPEAHNSRAITLFDLRRLDAAVSSCEGAIALRPDFAAAHLNRATALLSLGDLQQGFEEYRWRWRVNGFQPAIGALRPVWDGKPLHGKSILVYGEQGFGDHLQFCRYIPLVKAIADSVALMTEPALATLFRRSFPGVDVTTTVEADARFDVQAALMDLPHVFGTTLGTIPASVPYLTAEPAAVAGWRERLRSYEDLRVGLVWAGDSHRGRPAGVAVDRRRSLRLAQFAPLAGVHGVTFFSLQKGEAAAQASATPPGMRLIDLTADLHDFSDTAALIASLDLVIAVDTAVAHLAGALAKPVWILSRYEGDWRWLNGREDSPWYPTARVFHQRASGAWDQVVTRVAAELAIFAREGSSKGGLLRGDQ